MTNETLSYELDDDNDNSDKHNKKRGYENL